jgi:hypothetical protein
MADRIKGQDVEIMIVADNVAQSTITDIRSFEVESQMEILREGYLGETTQRRDDIFNGVRGKMELHFENKDVFDLIQTITDRARRRTPGTIVNIKATLRFPNGQRPRVLIPNVFFGPIPMNFGSRSDYGTVTLDFESSDVTVIA